MSAEMRDLAERLANANSNLLDLARTHRNRSLSVSFDGTRTSVEADRIEAKAEGVRLALSYLNEYSAPDGGRSMSENPLAVDHYCKVCGSQWYGVERECPFGCKPARYNVGRMFRGQSGRFVGLAVIEGGCWNA